MEISTILIYRKIKGTLSEEENRRFETWLNESKLHRRYFEKMKRMNEMPKAQQLSEEEIEAAWIVFARKLKKKQRLSYFHRPMFVYWSAVAVICIGLFIFILLNVKDDKSLRAVPTVHRITPGHRDAILYLSDGSQHRLGKQNNSFQEKSGIEVKVDSTRLVYSARIQKTDSMRKLIFHKLDVPRGGEYTVDLEDGSKVYINSESCLTYPVAFVGTSREIYLEGEAYFEIQKDTLRPFIVHAGDMEITVLGTSFGVTCYRDEEEVHTTLVQGKVEVNFKSKSGPLYILEPGMQLRYDKKYDLVVKKQVDVQEYVAWHDGKYVFKKKRLEDILTILSRWYNFTVFYQNADAKEALFSGELKRFDNFNYILHLLEEVGDVRFAVDKNVVKVRKR